MRSTDQTRTRCITREDGLSVGQLRPAAPTGHIEQWYGSFFGNGRIAGGFRILLRVLNG
ncbi:hypothetical protein HPP92_017696 [Vanilla planifolia]|uniref:Uncharacterized protein n=1 Tax=Vanilla planifolia TaxID=51239 RepID=A0A835UNU3_VANPL|nr:hypothetical protein HPP92_017696 [Vanilla planifolia]